MVVHLRVIRSEPVVDVDAFLNYDVLIAKGCKCSREDIRLEL